MTVLLFALASFAATFMGGLFALKHDDRLHFILSFAAGALIGVVSFDILPEIFTLAREEGLDPSGAMMAMVGGFLLFHGLEKLSHIHHAQEGAYKKHQHPRLGFIAAGALVAHSFMDGMGIGFGFQLSAATGLTVALAVITHDFCDGINTVSLMLLKGNSRRAALSMLALDALAPVLGAVATLWLKPPPEVMLIFLGFFGGFLLYISAADILPEAHSRAAPAATVRLVLLTALGAGLIYIVLKAIPAG